MKRILRTIIILVTILSCENSRDGVNVILPDNVKTDAIELISMDTLVFPEVNIEAYSQLIYRDSILIIWNSSKADKPFLEFKSLRNNSLITSFFQKGNGPDELLSFQYRFTSDSEIHVMDAVKGIVMDINIDSLLNNDYSFNRKEHLSRLGLDGPWPFNNKYLYYNTYVYQNKSLDIDVKGDKFFFDHYVDNHSQKMVKYEFRTRNINQGFIVVNVNMGKFVFFSNCQSFCEVYDSNLNMIRRCVISKDLKDQKFLQNTYGNSIDLIFSNTIPEAFTSAWSNSEYIYAVYLGEKIDAFETYDAQLLATPSYILQFDWDGNFIRSFRSDNYIRTISVSEDGNYLYANIFSKEGEPYVIKYALYN